MIEIVILDLNMKAVNAMIWASAVLAKIAVMTSVCLGIVYGIVFLISLLD